MNDIPHLVGNGSVIYESNAVIAPEKVKPSFTTFACDVNVGEPNIPPDHTGFRWPVSGGVRHTTPSQLGAVFCAAPMIRVPLTLVWTVRHRGVVFVNAMR